MDANALTNHLADDHGIDRCVARHVIAGVVDGGVQDEAYLRGFHDGLHGVVDADDHDAPGHGV